MNRSTIALAVAILALITAAVIASVVGSRNQRPDSSTRAVAEVATTTTSTTMQLHNIRGTIELDLWRTLPDGSCQGDGGFDDIHAGANVTIEDENGRLVGAGAVSTGRIVNGGSCQLEFSTVGFVEEALFYTVYVGDRGGPTWSRRTLQFQSWEVALTLMANG